MWKSLINDWITYQQDANCLCYRLYLENDVIMWLNVLHERQLYGKANTIVFQRLPTKYYLPKESASEWPRNKWCSGQGCGALKA